jgi:hypothetical protein
VIFAEKAYNFYLWQAPNSLGLNKITCFVILTLGGLMHCFTGSAQQADTVPKLKISGYVDAYYAYYTDSLGTKKYQKFPAISPRSNTFGLNIAQITEQFTSKRIRSTATLQFGDLPTVAWAPDFNFIQEANVGVCLAKNLWLDAGFFKTHIGTEALLPKDNITSSVAMITYFEPWWQAGVRLTFSPSDKFIAALYIVNGYNAFGPVNKKKAAGLAITYAINENFSLGYYNFLSDGTADYISVSHWRFLNNLVFNFALAKKLKGILGVDYIIQENSNIPFAFTYPLDYNTCPYTGTYASAYSFIFTLKYQASNKFGIYGRVEDFQDPQSILGEELNLGYRSYDFGVVGETLGIEYKPMGNSYIRLEGRELEMNNGGDVFYANGKYVGNRAEVMLCIGAWF